MQSEKIVTNKKGVTLLGLVVMVIIIIILAGITISLIIGERNIFHSAELSKEEHKKGQIIEYLDLKLLDKQSVYLGQTNEYVIEQTREDVIQNQNDLKQIGKEVEIQDVRKEEKVRFYVVVDKGIYEVSIEGTKYIGVVTVTDAPTITIEDKDTWTKTGKNVTISKLEGYTTKYTTDGTVPTKDNRNSI